MEEEAESITAASGANTGIARVKPGEHGTINVRILRDGAAAPLDIGNSYIAVEGGFWLGYRVVSAKEFRAAVKARKATIVQVVPLSDEQREALTTGVALLPPASPAAIRDAALAAMEGDNG